jgi:hypothetical protein
MLRLGETNQVPVAPSTTIHHPATAVLDTPPVSLSSDDEIQVVKEVRRPPRIQLATIPTNSVSKSIAETNSASGSSQSSSSCVSSSEKRVDVDAARKIIVPDHNSTLHQNGISNIPTISNVLPSSTSTGLPPSNPMWQDEMAELLKAPKRRTLAPKNAANHVLPQSSSTANVLSFESTPESNQTAPDQSSVSAPESPNTSTEPVIPLIPEQINDDTSIFDGVVMKQSIITQLQANGISSLKEFQKKMLGAMMAGSDISFLGSSGVGKTFTLVLSVLLKVITKLEMPQIFFATPTVQSSQQVF